MKEKIIEQIKIALGNLGIEAESILLEHPADMKMGDYSTNVAMMYAKKLSINPRELAEKIKTELENKIPEIEKIEVAGAGFINFYIKREFFISEIKDAQNKDWGDTQVYKDKKILVEHSSPNLFKPFHIGHLMNNTIGESLTRLAKHSGAHVDTISFPSDISLGVAKAIFVILEKLDKDETYQWDDIVVLGNSYVEGTKRYDEDVSIHNRVKEIADNLYAQKDSEEYRLFELAKHFNISYFEQIVESLGSHFDSYIYESEAGTEGKKIVLENTPKVFTESEGAVVYIPQEESNLHTAVFINSQGNPTYEAKDLGLLHLKFSIYNPDLSVFITDGQQVSHFQVVLDAAKNINKNWSDKSFHKHHGRMTFKGQKMSSRLGGVPIVEDILNVVIEDVKEKNPDITDKAARQIGIGAIKFAILKNKAGMNIDFNPETSLSFEGDSGPYLQYVVVRAGSLLEKGNSLGIKPNMENKVKGTENIEKIVARFTEVVKRSQTELAPHYLVTYLIELAQNFNSWYGQGKIIDDNVSDTAYRLFIVSATRNTIKNGLNLLGIQTPDKM